MNNQEPSSFWCLCLFAWLPGAAIRWACWWPLYLDCSHRPWLLPARHACTGPSVGWRGDEPAAIGNVAEYGAGSGRDASGKSIHSSSDGHGKQMGNRGWDNGPAGRLPLAGPLRSPGCLEELHLQESRPQGCADAKGDWCSRRRHVGRSPHQLGAGDSPGVEDVFCARDAGLWPGTPQASLRPRRGYSGRSRMGWP